MTANDLIHQNSLEYDGYYINLYTKPQIITSMIFSKVSKNKTAAL